MYRIAANVQFLIAGMPFQ